MKLMHDKSQSFSITEVSGIIVWYVLLDSRLVKIEEEYSIVHKCGIHDSSII